LRVTDQVRSQDVCPIGGSEVGDINVKLLNRGMICIALKAGRNPNDNVYLFWTATPTFKHFELLTNAGLAVTSDWKQRGPEVAHRIEQQHAAARRYRRNRCFTVDS